MKNPHFHCQSHKGKRIHHSCPQKNCGNDDEKLLFELFKQFLRTKLEEERQTTNQEEESAEKVQENVEIGENMGETLNRGIGCNASEKPRCQHFGNWKRDKHQKHRAKHHHGHKKAPHHHHIHHGPNHHRFHQHFSCGGDHQC